MAGMSQRSATCGSGLALCQREETSFSCKDASATTWASGMFSTSRRKAHGLSSLCGSIDNHVHVMTGSDTLMMLWVAFWDPSTVGLKLVFVSLHLSRSSLDLLPVCKVSFSFQSVIHVRERRVWVKLQPVSLTDDEERRDQYSNLFDGIMLPSCHFKL